jgi:hypothetical protein
MPDFISPLDGNYISLKRAARLIAEDRPGIEADEIMELFKHAIFTGEFEHPKTAIPADEESNLPLLRIELPRTKRAAPSLAPDRQPQAYFGAKAATIADVLIERNALPGTAADWSIFSAGPRDEKTTDDLLHVLARLPYAALPDKARDILGGIMLATAKLRAWMAFKSYALPPALKDAPPPSPPGLKLVEPCAETPKANADRGRPRKAGWPRIEQLIREMHAANPAMPLGTLAFDACKQAAADYPKQDLPSWETVLRNMKTILSAPLWPVSPDGQRRPC